MSFYLKGRRWPEFLSAYWAEQLAELYAILDSNDSAWTHFMEWNSVVSRKVR